MNWHNVLLRPRNLYEELLRRKLISGGGVPAVLQTITGISPLTLLNVASKGIKSLTQFGKCEQASSPTPSAPVDIACNNGKLGIISEGVPIEYIRVEYLQSSGTQYIDSGVKVNYATQKIEQTATVQFTVNNTDRELMGANGYGFWGKSANNKLESVTGSSVQTTESALVKNTVSLITDPNNNNQVTFIVNSHRYDASASTLVNNDYACYVFALGGRNGVAASFFCNAKVYEYTIILDNVVVSHLIPVKRRSDGVLGMYDTVTNSFKVNAGTGTFIAGNAFGSIGVVGTPEVLTVVDGRRTLSAVLGGTIESRGGTNGTENNKRARIEYQYLKAGTYTLSTSGVCDQAILCSYSSEQGADFEPIGSWSWVALPRTFTLESGRYVRAMVRKSTDEVLTSANIGDFQIDAFSGYPEHQTQTATAENLLGVTDFKDEQEIISGAVTRACGIKVLDGTEEWATDTYGGYRRMVLQEVLNASGDTLSVTCSHYVSRSADARQQPNSIFIASSGKMVIYVGSSQNFTTGDEFNAWLAQQYANGTPVVIVYPLAEATTEQVTAQHLSARDTATITAQTNNISDISLEVQYWQKAE